MCRRAYKEEGQKKMIEITKTLYTNNKNKVGTYYDESPEFVIKTDLKQRCVPSPTLFSITMVNSIKKSKKSKVWQWRIGNQRQESLSN